MLLWVKLYHVHLESSIHGPYYILDDLIEVTKFKGKYTVDGKVVCTNNIMSRFGKGEEPSSFVDGYDLESICRNEGKDTITEVDPLNLPLYINYKYLSSDFERILSALV